MYAQFFNLTFNKIYFNDVFSAEKICMPKTKIIKKFNKIYFNDVFSAEKICIPKKQKNKKKKILRNLCGFIEVYESN